jgi:catechol 2,3-dioxygenase-like lactoylglutathione lyase family enzyme
MMDRVGPDAPRFNHVGFTVPRDALRGARLARAVAFFTEVLGWTERKELTVEGQRLVLMAHGLDQFVAVFGHDAPTAANPPIDHFGMAVPSLAELQALLARARAFQARDADLEVQDYAVSDFRDVRPYRLHKFYVRYLLPFSFEVQYYEMLDGPGAGR